MHSHLGCARCTPRGHTAPPLSSPLASCLLSAPLPHLRSPLLCLPGLSVVWSRLSYLGGGESTKSGRNYRFSIAHRGVSDSVADRALGTLTGTETRTDLAAMISHAATQLERSPMHSRFSLHRCTVSGACVCAQDIAAITDYTVC